jgi:hypothetical protein
MPPTALCPLPPKPGSGLPIETRIARTYFHYLRNDAQALGFHNACPTVMWRKASISSRRAVDLFSVFIVLTTSHMRPRSRHSQLWFGESIGKRRRKYASARMAAITWIASVGSGSCSTISGLLAGHPRRCPLGGRCAVRCGCRCGSVPRPLTIYAGSLESVSGWRADFPVCSRSVLGLITRR